jgi:hypothetical protein
MGPARLALQRAVDVLGGEHRAPGAQRLPLERAAHRLEVVAREGNVLLPIGEALGAADEVRDELIGEVEPEARAVDLRDGLAVLRRGRRDLDQELEPPRTHQRPVHAD